MRSGPRPSSSPLAALAPLVPAVLVGVFAVTVLAITQCSWNAEKMPPALGGCLPTRDAGCPEPSVAPGGIGPDGGGSSSSSSSSSGAVVSCGSADALVMTMNVLCRPCITALDGCCPADLACTGSCLTLFGCINGCALGDTACVGTCENMWPDGLEAYQGFANCIAMNCTPQCPALQQ